MSFADKVVFITGASRGIGKEIALRLAKDGAKIVIAAKTAETHDKLPGTIYSAAEEVERAGGRALPLVVDVREEEQVANAFETAAAKFGGIDILINNASAIYLRGTLDTPMKRFDLMHQVNYRGTYLCSKLAIPYLKKSNNPHILTLSPPLNMNPRWFKHHTAYTISKYNMSMCVLGLAEEFRHDRIAVNALWPRTTIATVAVANMVGGQAMVERSRKPQIMADAAYWILSQNAKDVTGEFFIDDEVLGGKCGITDFEPYAVSPGAKLMGDFFLD